jgi:hypothetical protein
MENFTRDIETLLTRKLSLYHRFNLLLEEEKQFIINMDVESLWQSAETKKKIANEIIEVRAELLKISTKVNGKAEMTTQGFSLNYFIRTLFLEPEKKSVLRKLKLSIEREKDTISAKAKENRSYVREYLGVIDDIMSVFADNSNRSQYSRSGNMPDTKTANCLIHAQV